MANKELAGIVLRGVLYNATHCIIYCDHFDYTPGITYVKKGEDVHSVIDNILSHGSIGMYSIDYVYNYGIQDLTLFEQLREGNPYHIEPKVQAEYMDHPYGALYNISPKLREAIEYAYKIHEKEVDINGDDYIYYLQRVIKNIIKHKESHEIELLLISACLQSTIKSAKDIYNLNHYFGSKVTALVLEITPPEIINSIFQTQETPLTTIKRMSSWALVIKLCDLLESTNSIQKCNNDELINNYSDIIIDELNLVLTKPNLSQTHISIIKQIVKVLFTLLEKNHDKAAKLAKVIENNHEIKSYFQKEIDKFLFPIKPSNPEDVEGTALNILKMVLKAPGSLNNIP